MKSLGLRFLPAAALLGAVLLGTAGSAMATGLATCDSGSKDTWRPVAELEKKLQDQGWQIRRIKEDGGCYEVYAFDKDGKKGEFYFHPQTLDPVATTGKGRSH